MITPILTYGSEICRTDYTDIIEYVHLQYCSDFLGVNSTISWCMILSDCGRLTLWVIYKTKVMKYCCKLLHMPNNRYPNQCYFMFKEHDEIGRVNCATKVKNLLCT